MTASGTDHSRLGIVLEARGVRKVYRNGVEALTGIDLDVRRGETVALIGESGCGKTTLLRTFNRTVEPTSGEVWFGDSVLTALDPVTLRRQIGYVPQEGGLMPHWPVLRNVELVPTLLRWHREQCRRRAFDMLQMVGLDPESFALRHPIQLSGGERQRVAIARALAADPQVILLDEPFGALDAITRHELQTQFLDLKERLGKSTLLVTHDLAEAFFLADRVAVMRDGRILQVATPREIVASPADAYVTRLIEGSGSR